MKVTKLELEQWQEESLREGSVLFYSNTQETYIKYFPRDLDHHWAGWLFRWSASGNWVSFRKATDQDVKDIEDLFSRKYSLYTISDKPPNPE